MPDKKELQEKMVRAKGLEPSRRRHQNLNLARLPIPPRPQRICAHQCSNIPAHECFNPNSYLHGATLATKPQHRKRVKARNRRIIPNKLSSYKMVKNKSKRCHSSRMYRTSTTHVVRRFTMHACSQQETPQCAACTLAPQSPLQRQDQPREPAATILPADNNRVSYKTRAPQRRRNPAAPS